MFPNEAYSIENYKQAMNEAITFCRQHGLTRILADIRSLEHCIPLIDKYELGVHIARLLGSQVRLAILAQACIIDKLGENAAVNRGGKVLVTEDLKLAMEWLKAEE